MKKTNRARAQAAKLVVPLAHKKSAQGILDASAVHFIFVLSNFYRFA